MDAPKVKKTKTIQIKYPAPYSQSWSGPPSQTRKTSAKKSPAQKPPGYKREGRPQLRCRGPDPTLPHLKYGLFPKKLANLGQSRFKKGNEMQENVSDGKAMIKTSCDDDVPAAPLFVVRAIDSRFTKRLTRTASTHRDIKPRSSKFN